MSEKEKDTGITDSSDIDSSMKYKETQGYQKTPNIKVDKKKNKQREINLGIR